MKKLRRSLSLFLMLLVGIFALARTTYAEDKPTQPVLFPVYPVTVDYRSSVEDMIAAGNYDGKKDKKINVNNFGSNRTGTAELGITLVKFDHKMYSDEVRQRLDNMGLRPIELSELLALGKEHPNIQRSFPIIALGPIEQKGRDVPYLRGNSNLRLLSLNKSDFDAYRADCRFAAVRK